MTFFFAAMATLLATLIALRWLKITP